MLVPVPVSCRFGAGFGAGRRFDGSGAGFLTGRFKLCIVILGEKKGAFFPPSTSSDADVGDIAGVGAGG